MRLSRRTLLGSAFVTLFASQARSQLTPAPAQEDGFTLLETRKGALQLLPPPAPLTPIWGFGGQVPGPLLRVKLGQEVKARLVNRLDQATSLHWRGVRIVNAMDGAAGLTQKPVEPGGSFDYRFTPPDAGTFFYQPLMQPFSGAQQGRGLYGALIVDEVQPVVVDLEFILFLDDWRLDAKGQNIDDFDNPADALRQGRLGATVSVNSQVKPPPIVAAPGARLRLRLINAANARIMFLTFDGAKPQIIAIDGQPCDAFEPVRRTFPIGPGARFDVILDLPPTEAQTTKIILRGETELPDEVILAFVTKGAASATSAKPLVAPTVNPLLPAEIRLQASKKFDLTIEGGAVAHQPASANPTGAALRHIWKINGKSSTGVDGPPLFSVRRGAAVTLGFINKSLYPLDMHVHGHAMRLLHDLDDGWEPYWRDSVIVPELKTKHVAFVADNPGKWMIHCAIQEHLANGLAGWFEVN